VRLAVAAGFDPSAIAYQRPVLDSAELAAAIRAGIRRFHAFRARDLDHIAAAAEREGVTLRVSLRVASGRSALPFFGRSNRRLGFDSASLVAGAVVRPRGGVVVDALNVYCGTQQVSPERFRAEVRALLRGAASLGRRGIDIEEINLGGGVPSPSMGRRTSLRGLIDGSGGRPRLRLRDYAERLSAIFADEAGRAGLRPRLALEPGRSVVGNAVVVLTRVRAEQGSWRFLDCGRNVLVESPIAFSRLIEPLDARPGSEVVHLSGPTLNTLDVVDYRRRLPPLREGDVVVIGDAGAYCLGRATRYAGLLPALWSVGADGSLCCIREADCVEGRIP
jgi:diaminopimelate decarboxylase